jgi:hypothetical protein
MFIILTGRRSPDADGETIVITVHSVVELVMSLVIARRDIPDILGDSMGGRQSWEGSRDSREELHVGEN